MSGVYIKDMEMPPKGEYKPIFIYDTGEVTTEIRGEEVQIATAIPVPDHGRLIDADAFIRQKTEQICENCDRRRGMKNGKLTKRFVYAIGGVPCRACEVGDMNDYVDDAPTVIPADEEGEK